MLQITQSMSNIIISDDGPFCMWFLYRMNSKIDKRQKSLEGKFNEPFHIAELIDFIPFIVQVVLNTDTNAVMSIYMSVHYGKLVVISISIQMIEV